MKNLYLMHQKILSIVMLAVSVCLFQVALSCNQGPPENSRAAQAQRGAAIFKIQCAPCHGMGEMMPTVDTLKTPAPNLENITREWGMKEFPLVEIARFIDGRNMIDAHGTREMPIWGEKYEEEGLDKEQIRGRKGELIAYLMSIQK